MTPARERDGACTCRCVHAKDCASDALRRDGQASPSPHFTRRCGARGRPGGADPRRPHPRKRGWRDTRKRGWVYDPSAPKTRGTMSVMPLHDRARTTCVVADDHPPILDCLTRFLTAAGFDVLDTTPDGERALASVLAHEPMVCVADVRMPKLDGLEL